MSILNSIFDVLMCINSFELYGNFHTVPEPEYYGAISGHRGGIDERQPKLFIKLSNWSAPIFYTKIKVS